MSTRARITGSDAWRGAEMAKRPDERMFRLSPGDVQLLHDRMASEA